MSNRTVANPKPKIPSLGSDNAIDLDSLGFEALETFIDYDGIEDGDMITVLWFGCGAHGEIVDKFDDDVEVVEELLTPEGMPVMIENDILQLLINGIVFYAYQVTKPQSPPSGASRRLFFYVGRRPRATNALPVLQIRESHDRHLDLELVGAIITPWMVPYQAMNVGDVVTLYCRRFDSDGEEIAPVSRAREVKEGEPGEPLDLFLTRNEVERVEDGSIELYYGIQYVGTDEEPTFSARQTFQVSRSALPKMPALEIIGHEDPELNPELYPDGLTLRIGGYADMSDGDELLCHAYTDALDRDPAVLRASVDASTLDKGFIDLVLGADWVRDAQGAAMKLEYQYAWEGVAHSSSTYQINVREPLNLPWVIVKDAYLDPVNPVEGEGLLNVRELVTSGITIMIDPDANYGATATVKLHFDGYGTGGKYIATEPAIPGTRTYNIPAHYIPYNFARSVRVYYTVLQDGDVMPTQSEVFILRILPIDKERYSPIQSVQGQQNGGTIYLDRMGSGGELFTLSAWPYMRAGQIVSAVMTGKGNNDEDVSVPVIENYRVVDTDLAAKKIEKSLLQAGFQPFKLGGVEVQVTITYEEGAETAYTPARFTLARATSATSATSTRLGWFHKFLRAIGF